MNKASVELTIRYSYYGEQSKTVILPISDELFCEITTRLEWSDEPFSILFASPGMFGGKGNAITTRERVFKMRREVAEDIAKSMVPELLKVFGVNDELDGYSIDKMTDEERAYQKSRGRL